MGQRIEIGKVTVDRVYPPSEREWSNPDGSTRKQFTAVIDLDNGMRLQTRKSDIPEDNEVYELMTRMRAGEKFAVAVNLDPVAIAYGLRSFCLHLAAQRNTALKDMIAAQSQSGGESQRTPTARLVINDFQIDWSTYEEKAPETANMDDALRAKIMGRQAPAPRAWGSQQSGGAAGGGMRPVGAGPGEEVPAGAGAGEPAAPATQTGEGAEGGAGTGVAITDEMP